MEETANAFKRLGAEGEGNLSEAIAFGSRTCCDFEISCKKSQLRTFVPEPGAMRATASRNVPRLMSESEKYKGISRIDRVSERNKGKGGQPFTQSLALA